VILGVSFDDVPKNRAFAEKLAFPFALLSDTDRAIGLAYGACDAASDVWAKRITYVIGSDRRILAVFGKVHTKTHAADVLAKL
jgi:peroxiredoxin Q/BCP